MGVTKKAVDDYIYRARVAERKLRPRFQISVSIQCPKCGGWPNYVGFCIACGAKVLEQQEYAP